MKNWLRFVLMALALTMCSEHCAAIFSLPRDTVYFYDTWGQMMDMTPSEMVVSPVIEICTPYEIDIYKSASDYKLNDHLAATLGDSTWLISSTFLMKNFTGDTDRLNAHKFIPVFFNEKVAYLTYVGPGQNLSVGDILKGGDGENFDYSRVMDFFYLDFKERKVLRVTPDVLSGLLEDYHDLLIRYESMKDYKKRPVIQDYFLQYVDRATTDIMHPYILDLVK